MELIAFLDVLSLICLLFLLYQINQVITRLQVSQIADEHEDVRAQLTTYELERLEREDTFDKRISQIKEELASQQQIIKSSGISADELHPLVKNLPHNIIAEKHGEIPDVEYAD